MRMLRTIRLSHLLHMIYVANQMERPWALLPLSRYASACQLRSIQKSPMLHFLYHGTFVVFPILFLWGQFSSLVGLLDHDAPYVVRWDSYALFPTISFIRTPVLVTSWKPLTMQSSFRKAPSLGYYYIAFHKLIAIAAHLVKSIHPRPRRKPPPIWKQQGWGNLRIFMWRRLQNQIEELNHTMQRSWKVVFCLFICIEIHQLMHAESQVNWSSSF